MLNPDSKVLQKIKKLLALSKGNANAHERERAMEAAHKLLKEHNLEMSAVEAVGNEVQGSVFDKIKIEPWVEAVFTAAGILYFTSVIKQGTRKGRSGRYVYHPYIIGRPENIAVTCEMAAFFCHSIKAEAKRLFTDARSIRSFKVGAGMTLLIRAKQVREAERRKAKEEAARNAMRDFLYQQTSTALACIHDKREDENERFLQDRNVGESRRAKMGELDGFATQCGAAYARSISLAPIAQKRLETKEDGYAS